MVQAAPHPHATGVHQPLLAIERVGKRFGGHTALADVSVQLHAGEIIALAGENGAGKSTLMAICSGAMAPDTGTLRWKGTEVTFRSAADARHAGIAIVHQEPQLVPSLSVAENLLLGELPRRAAGYVDWPAVERTASQALARIGLSLPLHTPVASLGPGVRQLLAIARAMHGGAQLLILDEPTSSLSLGDANRLAQLVREVADRGTAVIYISHRIEELRPLARRLVVLRDGRVTLDAPLATVSAPAMWTAMAGGPHQEPSAAGTEHSVSADPRPLLEVEGLSQRRGLRAVSLRVGAGEIVGLAGLVGSGRSRLLHTIFGHTVAEEGQARVSTSSGWRTIRSIDDAVRAGVGLVPEDRRRQGLVLGSSVAENIALAIPADAVTGGWIRHRRLRERAVRAISQFRIRTQGPAQPVRNLSGGNQQKVLLARWLRPGTRVLLLDEPTRGVDVGAKAEIHHYLRTAAADGVGLLVASSDLPELLALCDRIYIMRAGAIVGERRADATTTTHLLTVASGAAA